MDAESLSVSIPTMLIVEMGLVSAENDDATGDLASS